MALAASTLSELARLRAEEADQRRWEAEASRDELRMLADQQAALRRIATLVARAVAPSELFSAVAEELARCLGVTQANLVRYEADGGSILLASHDDRGSTKEVPVGRRFAYEGENVASMVLRAGRRPPKEVPGAIRISRRTRSVSATMKDAATTAPSHSGGVVGRTNSDIKRARMGRTSVVASESAPSDVASGLDDHQPGIAHRLWVTEGTVEKHVRSIPHEAEPPRDRR